MNKDEFKNQVKQKTSSIRLRTWTATLAIFVAIILYILINVATKSKIDPIDFVFLVIIQLVLYSLFFPDGELSGAKDETFMANHNAYNQKAGMINEKYLFGELRDYCDYEFEERKKRYILEQCAEIGITIGELENIKQMPPKKVKKLDCYEVKCEQGSKLIHFSKAKQKKLYALCFKDLPVEKNSADFVMSGVKTDNNKAISDLAVDFKRKSFFGKLLTAVCVGAFLAYIGYSLKDGIDFSTIVKLAIFISTMITTSVTAFASGEKCTKVYKNTTYINLVNFIDAFMAWHNGKHS